MSRFALSCMVLSCCVLPMASRAEAPKAGCYERAETQGELNSCAGEEYAAMDAELNRVYKAVLERYKDDPKFLAKLQASQRAWLKYRDAEFEARFPHAEESRYYGSVFPMCAAQIRTVLTQERITKLREWLEGTEEGDVCAGSVKVKGEP